ncbi:hypothetical protein ACFZCL_40615 [Streptomyces sp. NPDC008159]|uniref:hypothetical protein n=1 Tax=Streptomyces sp. NPDC008159 TaxID=3364817 RepID=UPI0036E88EA8
MSAPVTLADLLFCWGSGGYPSGRRSTYSVPASAWLTDTSQYNVLRINVVSGSGTTSYLSAGTAIDAIDLLS